MHTVEATRVPNRPATGHPVGHVAERFPLSIPAGAGIRLDPGNDTLENLEFLAADEGAFLGRIRARTSLRLLALIARVLAASDSVEGRFLASRADMALFVHAAARYRDIETAVSAGMPIGYAFTPRFSDLLAFVVERGEWSIAAFTCHTLVSMRAFALPHDVRFARPDAVVRRIGDGSELALNHSVNEWRRVNAGLSDTQRDRAVDELIVLLQGIDALLLFQVDEDVRYLTHGHRLTRQQIHAVSVGLLTEYRTAHIETGLRDGAFAQVLRSNVAPAGVHRLRVELSGMGAGANMAGPERVQRTAVRRTL